MTKRVRIPEINDRVGSSGLHGVFAVIGIDEKLKTADLQLLGGTQSIEKGIPWTILSYLDEEDVNQAAARVVREATEGQD
jgi:hypothetical protein